MEGKLLYALLALVASTAASSIYAGIDPTKVYAGGEITFPRIPGINAPLFNFGGLFGGSNNRSNSVNNTFPRIPGITAPLFNFSALFDSSDNSSSSVNNTSSFNYTGSPFGPFTPFLRLIPGLNLLIPHNGQNHLPGFPNIEDVINRIPGLGSGRVNVSAINIPSANQGPYIPGVSEALAHAQKHLQAALNITTDFRTGIRDAIEVAINSENPVGSIRIILDTIARVYSTVAANCPLMIIGGRVLGEGIRLAGEVMRSLAHIAVGP